jgi:hypothetical protein
MESLSEGRGGMDTKPIDGRERELGEEHDDHDVHDEDEDMEESGEEGEVVGKAVSEFRKAEKHGEDGSPIHPVPEKGDNRVSDDDEQLPVEEEEKATPIPALSMDELSSLLRSSLDEMSLCLIDIEEGWFVIQRRRFDMIMRNEPYHALQVYYDTRSLRYLIRIWGRTRMEGTLDSHESLGEMCRTVFERTVACAGVVDETAFVRKTRHFLITAFPFDRQIARACQMSYKLTPRPTSPELKGIGLCTECSLSKFDQPGADGGFDINKVKEEAGGSTAETAGGASFEQPDVEGFLETGKQRCSSFFAGICAVTNCYISELIEDDEEDPSWDPDDDFEYFDDNEPELHDDGDEGAELLTTGCLANVFNILLFPDSKYYKQEVDVKQELSDGEEDGGNSDNKRDVRPRRSLSERALKRMRGRGNRRGRPRLSQMTPEEVEKWRSQKVGKERLEIVLFTYDKVYCRCVAVDRSVVARASRST